MGFILDSKPEVSFSDFVGHLQIFCLFLGVFSRFCGFFCVFYVFI